MVVMKIVARIVKSKFWFNCVIWNIVAAAPVLDF